MEKQTEKSLSQVDLCARIFRIRGQQVMLGQDLSRLYDVSVKALNQAVKRNLKRFPSDFMFQLSYPEFEHLKSQFVTSSWGGIRRARPYAFTEHGIAMLSCVLHSPQAISVSLSIIRAFIKLRHAVLAQKDLGRRIEKVEGRLHIAETDIRLIQIDLQTLKDKPSEPARRIKGFEN
jgi:hypothetical protein